MNAIKISISVVSHMQINLIEQLLRDLNNYCGEIALEFILTLNQEESLPFAMDSYSFPIKVIHNPSPLGFSANHNQAFVHTTGRFFCVMNPDIRLNDDPFPVLLQCLEQPMVGVAAPLVVSESGEIEDSARFFPSPLKIICKALGGCKGGDYVINDKLIFPDWVGGMFMLFPRQIFEKLKGFNQQFFLYYEDVDLCARLRLQGHEVVLCPAAKIVHDARRNSHKSFKYFKWHLTSMMRFFCSAVYFQVSWRKLIGVNLK